MEIHYEADFGYYFVSKTLVKKNAFSLEKFDKKKNVT